MSITPRVWRGFQPCSAEHDLNVASVDTTILSWRALHEGRFCTWFAETFPDRYP
jgi:hypothetical protein